jgi:predicted O-methyltransferase YrrM
MIIQDNLLPFKFDGMFSNDCKIGLNAIFDTYNIQDTIEIGSWIGESSVFIASKVKNHLYCIDPWELMPDQKYSQSSRNLEGKIYKQFLSNIIHSKLENKITPIKAKSQEAVKTFTKKVDLLYIDGSHDYKDVKHDILEWSKKLKPHGIICGDDWGDNHSQFSKGVVKAVIECSRLLRKEIYTIGQFWKLI